VSSTSIACSTGIQFGVVDGDVLFAYAKDEQSAAEIEDTFAPHISIIATNILKRDVGIVMVLPRLSWSGACRAAAACREDGRSGR
jgi:hypothetical protein